MGSIPDPTPYWNVNVAPELQTAECPDFLVTLTDKDRRIIGTPNDQYTVLTWPAVQKVIAGNRIDTFQRIPYELRRYRGFVWKIEREHGSILNFIMTQRLHWEEPLKPEGKPFECPGDIKILWNDWPYGIDEKIAHLVVWTKFELVDDPETGFLTPEASKGIDDFVHKTLSPRLEKDRVGDGDGGENDFAWFEC